MNVSAVHAKMGQHVSTKPMGFAVFARQDMRENSAKQVIEPNSLFMRICLHSLSTHCKPVFACCRY